jgi:hypothetical protein
VDANVSAGMRVLLPLPGDLLYNASIEHDVAEHPLFLEGVTDIPVAA